MGDLLLLLMFLTGLAWKGWPVSLWAMGAGALTWAVGRAQRQHAKLPGVRLLAGQLKGIALGLVVVWLAQLAGVGAGAVASDETVRSAEASMEAARASLPWSIVAAISLGLMVVSLLLHRRATASAVSFLTIVASVLLFGWEAARLAEARWLESRRHEASANLYALRSAQTGLVAIAEVRRRFAGLPPEDALSLASFLRAAESKKHRAEIVAEKVERLAANTREPEPPPSTDGADPVWAAVERCAGWLGAEAGGSAPAVRDLDTLGRVSVDLREREVAARASTESFENAVVEAVARRWTRSEWGRAVRDLASAEQVVASAHGHGPQGPQQEPEERWPLGAEAGQGGPRSEAAEVDASELAFESLDDPTPQPVLAP